MTLFNVTRSFAQLYSVAQPCKVRAAGKCLPWEERSPALLFHIARCSGVNHPVGRSLRDGDHMLLRTCRYVMYTGPIRAASPSPDTPTPPGSQEPTS